MYIKACLKSSSMHSGSINFKIQKINHPLHYNTIWSRWHRGPQSLIRLRSLIGSSGFLLFLRYKGFCYWCPISGFFFFQKYCQRYITWYGFLATSPPFSSSSPAFLFAFPSQSAAKWPIWPQRKHLFCWPGVNTIWKVAMPKKHISDECQEKNQQDSNHW